MSYLWHAICLFELVTKHIQLLHIVTVRTPLCILFCTKVVKIKHLAMHANLHSPCFYHWNILSIIVLDQFNNLYFVSENKHVTFHHYCTWEHFYGSLKYTPPHFPCDLVFHCSACWLVSGSQVLQGKLANCLLISAILVPLHFGYRGYLCITAFHSPNSVISPAVRDLSNSFCLTEGNTTLCDTAVK